MVDVEIERSVQLHEEKTLLQKKLTDLATRIQGITITCILFVNNNCYYS